MRTIRYALLVLLTVSLAGPGVPASFSQTATASKGKAASGNSTRARNSSSKKSGASKAASSSKTRTAAAPAKKGSTTASGRTNGGPAKKSSVKSATSKRTRKQPGQKAPTADRVIEIQAALAKDGSYQGTPSGKWDESTAAAMKRFQSAHGLNSSGKLDAPTLQRLGLGSQTAGVAAPTPPPGATSRLTSSASLGGGAALENGPRQ